MLVLFLAWMNRALQPRALLTYSRTRRRCNLKPAVWIRIHSIAFATEGIEPNMAGRNAIGALHHVGTAFKANGLCGVGRHELAGEVAAANLAFLAVGPHEKRVGGRGKALCLSGPAGSGAACE